MCRTQCVLALATLYLGLVHSWDIAVSVGDQLEFYTDGTKTDTVNLESHNLTAITYDEVHNMMLFVDKQNNNDAICGYSLSFKNISCFVKRFGSNIHDLAFDPATDMLFFTDTKDESINWISLKNQTSKDIVTGDRLIKILDRTPKDIEVDSCSGLIYWTNTDQRRRAGYMERARLNGSERFVVSPHTPVNSFALDLQTQKNYYFIGLKHNLLNKVDLRENNIIKHKKMIFYNEPRSAQELVVSKDYLYWTQSCTSKNTVWQMLKNASLSSAKPKVIRSDTGHTLGIAANYRIKDQVHGLQDCEALARLIPILEKYQTTEPNWSSERTETSKLGSGAEVDRSTDEIFDSTADPDWSTDSTETSDLSSTADTDRPESTETETELTTVSTTELDWSTESTFELDLQHISGRCEVSECHNYCYQGFCSLNEKGQPKCRCNAGYSGARCEVHACHSYCLNNGACSLNQQDEPVCQCVGNHEGTRCETVKKYSFSYTPQIYSANRNLTLADLVSKWRKPAVKVSVVVDV